MSFSSNFSHLPSQWMRRIISSHACTTKYMHMYISTFWQLSKTKYRGKRRWILSLAVAEKPQHDTKHMLFARQSHRIQNLERFPKGKQVRLEQLPLSAHWIRGVEGMRCDYLKDSSASGFDWRWFPRLHLRKPEAEVRHKQIHFYNFRKKQILYWFLNKLYH